MTFFLVSDLEKLITKITKNHSKSNLNFLNMI